MLEVLAPPTLPLFQTAGWTLGGRTRARRDSLGASCVAAHSPLSASLQAPRQRPPWDVMGNVNAKTRMRMRTTAVSDAAVNARGEGGVGSSAGGREVAGGGGSEDGEVRIGTEVKDGNRGGDVYVDADEGSSVLSSLRVMGASTKLLTLHERKALFEVGVKEQVAALIRCLFRPGDGADPRAVVHIVLN